MKMNRDRSCRRRSRIRTHRLMPEFIFIKEDAMAKPKTSQQDLILSLAALALIAVLVLASQLQNR